MLVRHRNVLNRVERLEKLKEEEKWADGKSVFGLPKVEHRKQEIVKAAKEATAEGAEGAAVPAAGTPGAAAPAAAGAPKAPAAAAGAKAPAAGAKAAAPAAKAPAKK